MNDHFHLGIQDEDCQLTFVCVAIYSIFVDPTNYTSEHGENHPYSGEEKDYASFHLFFLVNVYSYTHRPFEEAEGNVKPTWFIDPPASWKHYLYALI